MKRILWCLIQSLLLHYAVIHISQFVSCLSCRNWYQWWSVERCEHAGEWQAAGETFWEEHWYDYFIDWWNAKLRWASGACVGCRTLCFFLQVHVSAAYFTFSITFVLVVCVGLKERVTLGGSRRIYFLLLKEKCLYSVLDLEMMWITHSWMWWANKTREWPAEYLKLPMQLFNSR